MEASLCSQLSRASLSFLTVSIILSQYQKFLYIHFNHIILICIQLFQSWLLGFAKGKKRRGKGQDAMDFNQSFDGRLHHVYVILTVVNFFQLSVLIYF